ncbi:uncharacterized protein with HEPN domain [Arcicella aurantiaca]|uniref:Uncharacterized protein with HEPN domain n=1 Tax=Arcicella aurantiaca TaxID=591202 RepID=A0A316EEP0_9BACT|nr:DUF86 domain-containing protein [Arcicella aurantiaca]PWK27783.1 uncharacterized protein with HEPN domain [Arcicella aurantiaca]
MQDRLGDKVRLLHILEAASEILEYVKDATFEEFSSNSMMLNASVRQLEIIGEASNRLSENIHAANPEIPWRTIIGFRNVIVHEYFGLDDKIVWTVIQNEIPSLIPNIERIIETIS